MGSANNSLLSSIIAESMGENHVTVINALSEPKHDEDIASELGLKATVVRTLLNDLHVRNLVDYERTKNKKTGWYTYLWKKRDDMSDSFIESYLTEKLSELSGRLDEEQQGVRFACGCDGEKRVTMEEAMETDFECPCCSGMYVESDNRKIIKELESEIKRVQKQLK